MKYYWKGLIVSFFVIKKNTKFRLKLAVFNSDFCYFHTQLFFFIYS